MRLLLAVTLLLAAPLGCGATSGAAIPLVRAHAGRDLDCPDESIRVVDELGGRYKAVGCGRKAYYRSACDGLTCVVHGESEPGIPWKDRPEPGALPP